MTVIAKDMQDLLIRYLGGDNVDESVINCRNAASDALTELWSTHDWPHYQGQQTVRMSAPVSTGTIAYDASSRYMTISSTTWPDWVEYGTIVVGSKYAKVQQKISDTVVMIEDGTQFVDDIVAGTDYALHRDEYPIPNNIRKISFLTNDTNSNHVCKYVPPSEFRSRRPGTFGSVPVIFTVQKDRSNLNGLVLVVWPYPALAWTYRYAYVRAPHEIETWDHSDGKISVTASSSAIVGTNTSFSSSDVGKVLRVGTSAEYPTGKNGLNPYVEEVEIFSVTNATNATARTEFSNTRSNVKYCISSNIDIDSVIMNNAYVRQCYLALATAKNMDPKAVSILTAEYYRILRNAMSAANTTSLVSYAGNGTRMSLGQFYTLGGY